MSRSSLYAPWQRYVAVGALAVYVASALYLVWWVAQANRLIRAIFVLLPLAVLMTMLVVAAVRAGGIYRRPGRHGMHLWNLCAIGVVVNLVLVAIAGLW